jgi:hypothetical protein
MFETYQRTNPIWGNQIKLEVIGGQSFRSYQHEFSNVNTDGNELVSMKGGLSVPPSQQDTTHMTPQRAKKSMDN